MKPYEQIEDIMSLAADYHGRIARFYEHLTDKVEKEQVAMLLSYLSRHEKRLQEGLNHYPMDEHKKYSETWLQFVPGDEELMLEELEPSPDMTVDDLVEIVIDLDNRLLNFYRAVAESSSIPPGVRDIFKQLADQEQQEKARLVRIAEQVKKS